jgi:hypothetical protein
MKKRTTGLLIVLFLFLVIVLIALLRIGQPKNSPQTKNHTQISPSLSTQAHSTLYLIPDPVLLTAKNNGSIEAVLDTGSNNVTAVQLEMRFDPKVIVNVKVVPDYSFITHPIVLYNKVNNTTGYITFMLGISPGSEPVNGKGVVAIINFTKIADSNIKESAFELLPTSLATESGIDSSILKKASGTKIFFSR